MKRWIACCLLLVWSCCAHAHKPSDSYLILQVEGGHIAGQWDIALRDIDYAIGLDSDEDRAITWQELRSRHAPLAAYVFQHLQLQADGHDCTIRPGQLLVDGHTDGTYAVLRFEAECGVRVTALTVHYTLFFDIDAQHRGLLRLEQQGRTHTAIFASDQRVFTVTFAVPPSRAQEAWQYIREGVWHIATGYDHILFLLGLLLPSVLFAGGERRWLPRETFGAAFLDVLKVVTAFTVAHSITLSLAVFKVIELPSRWVESAIAASVILVALNNVRPAVHAGRWFIAFGFGLLHGLGFANVLLDLGLPQVSLAWALFAFNVGVELGQIVLVGMFLPCAYALRRTRFYQRSVLVGGSWLIAVVATVWLLERVFDWPLWASLGALLFITNGAGSVRG